MSDAELSRLETSMKRYLAQYWWAIVPSIIGATIWVTHQNTVAEQTRDSLQTIGLQLQAMSSAQHAGDLATQHVRDELARHEWTATNHENRIQWLEHRNEGRP